MAISQPTDFATDWLLDLMTGQWVEETHWSGYFFTKGPLRLAVLDLKAGKCTRAFCHWAKKKFDLFNNFIFWIIFQIPLNGGFILVLNKNFNKNKKCLT